ncbi:helix-turn-helix domain-containing protein [Paenibacillus sp. HJGM_3]|uniref:AraC family transcriptional regulator n=1 Tax=Paenibacillus sp. HJGM_3 TaxID=3379816 RepID=UPI00385C7961
MIQLHSFYFDNFIPSWYRPAIRSDMHILVFVVQGRMTYILDRQPYHLGKGDMLFIPAGTERIGSSPPPDPHQKYGVFFRENVPSTDIPILSSRTPELRKIRGFDYIRQRLTMLGQQWFKKQPYYETLCGSILTEILCLFAGEFESRHYSSKKLSMVEAIQQYIAEHYREPLQISQLGRLVDRTPSYVITTFREVTGMTPIDYLHHLRISAAKDLLMQTELSIVQIAEYLGFCDPSYFNRVFKKTLGLPPSEFVPKQSDVYASRSSQTANLPIL